ncbi:hypothetical protein ACWD7Y_04250 [Streptomyces drozdowiczii]
MPALRTALFIASICCVSVGLYLIATSHDTAPQREPQRVPAASIGPDGAEPAWAHNCPDTDDQPAECDN